MTFTVYDSTVPVFVNGLTAMRSWLDKAAAEKPEAQLIASRPSAAWPASTRR